MANFKETQLTDVREGQPVDIAVDMFPGQVVHGHVDSIAPASGQEFALLPPDNATGNFTKVVQRIPVKIALDADNDAAHRAASGHVGDPDHRDQITGAAIARAVGRHSATSTEQGFRRIVPCPITSFSLDIRASGRSRRDRSAQQPIRTAPASPIWIAVLAAMIGSFMAILNIQITNASLLNIEGGIGTGVDNGSWISTSYLIGEIVVIPLTDYLSRVFSFRRYMLASAALFAVVLGGLRLHPRSAVDDRDARPAGLCRRRADPDGVHAGADQAAEAAAAGRARDLRAVGDLCAGDRPDHRRLSHRKLRLADHLLRQRAADRR